MPDSLFTLLPLQGIMHTEKPIFTAQFHPEAFGGPTDTEVIVYGTQGVGPGRYLVTLLVGCPYPFCIPYTGIAFFLSKTQITSRVRTLLLKALKLFLLSFM